MQCQVRIALPKAQLASSIRCWHDRCAVPRVVDDPEAKMHTITDAGYRYRYHRPGVDTLPRLPGCKVPVHRPDYKVRDNWSKAQARF
ncbi:unnamed protein product [Gongylonema pulchrum]|uniref:Transposase n=1 Tax=Gongylonema pulchrum TaxID=637853 RepID=A0A183E1G0_9BILA|nr:unnamed protein product [Gongylonema pulchrum]